MKNWMKILEILAGKLTAILAFAALAIVLFALIGESIPEKLLPLVYIVVIAALIIFVIQILFRNKPYGSAERVNGGSTSKLLRTDTSPSKQSIDARSQYLRAIVTDYGVFPLDWLDATTADARIGKLTLESVYVALDTTTIKNNGGQLLSVLEAFSTDSKHCIVLVGLPGTGKTMFVRNMALRMA